MKSILSLIIGATALMVIGCNDKPKLETPNTLVNTHWYLFNEEVISDTTRITNEVVLKFFIEDVRLTNETVVTTQGQIESITHDTINGKYTYKMPKVNTTFDSIIVGNFNGEVDLNIMSFIVNADTIKFIKM